VVGGLVAEQAWVAVFVDLLPPIAVRSFPVSLSALN
jgi:hypothetical protein